MAQKLEVSTVNPDKIIFTDTKTAVAVGYEYLAPMESKAALKELEKENKGRLNLSRAVLSILIAVMQSPRLAAYRGQTPLNGAIPTEFKAALRESESAFLRPLLIENMKGMEQADKEKAADQIVQAYRAGGVYANVKSTVNQYFCLLGQLPCAYNVDGTPDTHKLMSQDAMKKLIANAKADIVAQASPFKNTIVRKAVELSVELENVKDAKPVPVGELQSGIAALKVILAKWEGMLKADTGSVSGTAIRVVAGAKASIAKGEAKPAKHQEPALV